MSCCAIGKVLKKVPHLKLIRMNSNFREVQIEKSIKYRGDDLFSEVRKACAKSQ